MKRFIKAVGGMKHSVIYTDADGKHFRFYGGTWAWRNHNPGNLRPKKQGKFKNQIGAAHKLAIFSDDKSGHVALLKLLRAVYGNDSIHKMIYIYAPPSENPTKKYEKYLHETTGVVGNEKIKDFTPAKFKKFWQAIQHFEGYRRRFKKMSTTIKIISFFAAFLFAPFIFADQLVYTYIPPDRIYYSSEANHKDNNRVTSPNKKWIAFVRRSHHVMPVQCSDFADTGSEYANEIGVENVKTKSVRLLVRDNFSCDHPTKMIVDPQSLKFSPDSKTLYFETSARPTSGAIHSVDVNGKNLRYVTDGNEYRVVMHGKYHGDLIVNQHRYRFKDGTPLGSYDWDWLFTSTGKQIKLYKKED